MTTLPIGSSFAGYVIEGVIARGGMGVVYRATQLHPNRQIALKLIAPEHATDPGYRERFLREADLLASVEHCPSIVPIYESGEFEGQLFLAMRYMDGADLGKRLEQDGPMSLPRTVEVLTPVAAALDAAHESGLVHRDVKPANILFDSRGRVYLTDFGLTKKAASDTGLTKIGQAIGTAGYMAPEQFTGRPSDPRLAPRIDVYALGCVLHSCLTGHEPYPRDSYEQALFAHVTEPPPKVCQDRPDLPPEVDDILARALAKDPTERYETAHDLVAALAAVAPRAGPFPPEPSARPGSSEATVLAGTVAGRTDLGVPPPPSERRTLERPPVSGAEVGSGGRGQDTVVVPGGGIVAGGGVGAGGAGGAGVGAGGGGGKVGGIPPRGRSLVVPAIAAGAAIVGLGFVLVIAGVIPPRASPSPIGGIGTVRPSVVTSSTPTPSPATTPTTTAEQRPSVEPTLTPSPGGRFGAEADVQALTARVPSDIRQTCQSSEIHLDAPIARIVCDRGSDLVWYTLYGDLDSLKSDFQLWLDLYMVTEGTGDCDAGTAGESTWQYVDDPDGVIRGHYVCALDADIGYGYADFTYEDSLILLSLVDTEGDFAGLYDEWTSGSLNPIEP